MATTFNNNLLSFIIIPLLVLAVGAVYVRFYVQQDYVVQYEIDCNPTRHSCFVGCETEDCSEVYYFAYIYRNAANIKSLCGPDITDCEAAASCSAVERNCRTEYCSIADETSECSLTGSQFDTL